MDIKCLVWPVFEKNGENKTAIKFLAANDL